MSGDPSRPASAARVLLVRGGDLAVIQSLMASVGASVEVLVDPCPEDGPSEMPAPAPRRLHVGPLVVDPSEHEVWLSGTRLRCTATEFAMLVCLAERPGRVFTRPQLLERLRDSADYVTERTVDTHVNNLRRKLGDGTALIETVFGVGYKLRAVPRRLEAVDSATSA